MHYLAAFSYRIVPVSGIRHIPDKACCLCCQTVPGQQIASFAKRDFMIIVIFSVICPTIARCFDRNRDPVIYDDLIGRKILRYDYGSVILGETAEDNCLIPVKQLRLVSSLCGNRCVYCLFPCFIRSNGCRCSIQVVMDHIPGFSHFISGLIRRTLRYGSLDIRRPLVELPGVVIGCGSARVGRHGYRLPGFIGLVAQYSPVVFKNYRIIVDVQGCRIIPVIISHSVRITGFRLLLLV